MTKPWHRICALDDIWPNTGAAALIGERQIAVFRYAPAGNAERLFALGNYDPIGKAFVMSRGILGTAKDGTPKVASPLYKQCYDLATGQCLDDAAVKLPIFAVRIVDGQVEIAA